MKNHKGAIATLLTLGLVVIGTLITLGTSLFVSNSKTNLASNSMAYTNPCPSFTCPENSSITAYKRGGTIYKYSDCTGALPYSQICYPPSSGGSTGTGTTLPVGVATGTCPYKNTTDATNKCKPYGYTAIGCKGKTYKCKPATIVQPPDASGNDGSDSNGTGGSGEVGPGQACCFRKKGLIYVYSTYEAMVNNEMNLNCSAHGVVGSYQADGPAFVCSGGIQNQTPEDEIDPADLDGSGTEVVPVNACEDQGYTCVDTVGKSPYTACSSDQYVKGVSCGDTTKACCTGPGGGTVGGGTTEPISRTGKLGEPCLYGTFQGQANTYYCINPGAKCDPYSASGVCVMPTSSGGTTIACSRLKCNQYFIGGNGLFFSANQTGGVIGTYFANSTCTSPSGTYGTDIKSYCTTTLSSGCTQLKCNEYFTGGNDLLFSANREGGFVGTYFANPNCTSPSGQYTTAIKSYCIDPNGGTTHQVGITASNNNSCKEQANDPLAYCTSGPFQNFPCKTGFEQSKTAKCGVTSKPCCVQKQQQAQQSQTDITISISGDCFEQNGETYCPVE